MIISILIVFSFIRMRPMTAADHATAGAGLCNFGISLAGVDAGRCLGMRPSCYGQGTGGQRSRQLFIDETMDFFKVECDD